MHLKKNIILLTLILLFPFSARGLNLPSQFEPGYLDFLLFEDFGNKLRDLANTYRYKELSDNRILIIRDADIPIFTIDFSSETDGCSENGHRYCDMAKVNFFADSLILSMTAKFYYDEELTVESRQTLLNEELEEIVTGRINFELSSSQAQKVISLDYAGGDSDQEVKNVIFRITSSTLDKPQSFEVIIDGILALVIETYEKDGSVELVRAVSAPMNYMPHENSDHFIKIKIVECRIDSGVCKVMDLKDDYYKDEALSWSNESDTRNYLKEHIEKRIFTDILKDKFLKPIINHFPMSVELR